MILVIDNYDSFTYNLVQYLGECGAEVDVRRNDAVTGEEVLALPNLSGVVLSPGPCTPKQSGVCLDLLRLGISGRLKVPMFGVCLGHEAIGEVQGSPIVAARVIKHGKASMIRHDGQGLLKGMPNPFRAIRYHSLVVEKGHVPAGFVVTSTSEDDQEIMGLRHESLPIEGVQFHPESVHTEEGIRIVRNFVEMTRLALV